MLKWKMFKIIIFLMGEGKEGIKAKGVTVKEKHKGDLCVME
jgi:hypothetical protein